MNPCSVVCVCACVCVCVCVGGCGGVCVWGGVCVGGGGWVWVGVGGCGWVGGWVARMRMCRSAGGHVSMACMYNKESTDARTHATHTLSCSILHMQFTFMVVSSAMRMYALV